MIGRLHHERRERVANLCMFGFVLKQIHLWPDVTNKRFCMTWKWTRRKVKKRVSKPTSTKTKTTNL